MEECRITCPECGAEITLDMTSPLARAVHDEEFERAVKAASAERAESMLRENDRLREELRRKDGEIAYLSDMRSRLSTKMVGESLELHCEAEFNRIRAAAFPRAEFHKDNDARSGSKGDYVYRELDADGTELLSIMFEMKSETGSSSRKHRNEEFLKELDKDRREKNCEYAVLVTLLEPDSELYNSGVVDLSYAYPKTYAVRPQCFVAIIGILRNLALDKLAGKRALAEAKAQSADLELLESRIGEFRAGFLKNASSAENRIADAVSEIDAVIAKLEKLRDGLSSAGKQLGYAAKKADGLTARKMAKGTGL